MFWCGAWLPEEEVGIGVEGVAGFGGDVHAGEAGLSVFAVALAQGAGAVQDDVRVVDELGIAWVEFDGADVVDWASGDGDDEVAEGVGAFCWESVGLGGLED